ncbi:MAG: HAMP domain-containing protein, partial [Planctomycetales bacterium]|nr:HAMP domain-containing protein [Planctomycetales bacterium]
VDELVEEMHFYPNRDELVAELERRFNVHSHFHFEIQDDEGNQIFRSRFLTHLVLPAAPSPGAMRGAEFANVDMPHIGKYRMVSLGVRDASARPLLLRALTSQSQLEKDFGSHVVMILTLVPIGFAISLGFGYLLAGRTLAPIAALNQSARRISAERLRERIQVVNEHDEVGQLAATLNEAFRRLDVAMDEMRRFTSDAAHELRSPIAVLRTEAEVALRHPRSVDEYRRVTEVTLAETKRLGLLVDQLLTLSRHDAGLVTEMKDEVPVHAILQDISNTFETIANEKDIQLVVESVPECVVLGDDIWLGQLFFNLLDNAFKFTPPGGTVRVSAKTADGRVEVCVEDTGIGIPEQDLPQVFHRFYRVDSSRSHYGGTGLGLAICRSIVESHHGRIFAESKLNRGARFTVQLPLIASTDACLVRC